MALNAPLRQRCFGELWRAAIETGFLPSDYKVPLELKKRNVVPNEAGGLSNIWKATSPSRTVFALKIPRVTMCDDISEINKVGKFL